LNQISTIAYLVDCSSVFWKHLVHASTTLTAGPGLLDPRHLYAHLLEALHHYSYL